MWYDKLAAVSSSLTLTTVGSVRLAIERDNGTVQAKPYFKNISSTGEIIMNEFNEIRNDLFCKFCGK